MQKILNKLLHKDRRRELRTNQTKTEKILWNFLRKKQIHRIRFCRQFGIGYYIADFYAPSLRLAIEVDGKQHESEDSLIYDNERDNYFRSLNIQVLRFKNEDILDDVENVVRIIKNYIGKLNLPQPSLDLKEGDEKVT